MRQPGLPVAAATLFRQSQLPAEWEELGSRLTHIAPQRCQSLTNRRRKKRDLGVHLLPEPATAKQKEGKKKRMDPHGRIAARPSTTSSEQREILGSSSQSARRHRRRCVVRSVRRKQTPSVGAVGDARFQRGCPQMGYGRLGRCSLVQRSTHSRPSRCLQQGAICPCHFREGSMKRPGRRDSGGTRGGRRKRQSPPANNEKGDGWGVRGCFCATTSRLAWPKLTATQSKEPSVDTSIIAEVAPNGSAAKSTAE